MYILYTKLSKYVKFNKEISQLHSSQLQDITKIYLDKFNKVHCSHVKITKLITV